MAGVPSGDRRAVRRLRSLALALALAPVPGPPADRPLPYDDLADGPVVEQVDRLLRRAAALGASDVHVEPFEREVRVRYRLDGVLHAAGALRGAHGPAVASRIKVLAALDVAERRRPQDGRLRVDHDGRAVDVRVSVLPTVFGEKVVLRLLDRGALALDLGALGLEPDDLAALRAGVAHAHGVALVTGPTGSGKTTTLYAALTGVASEGVNVTTVEDPVEYELPGVNQTAARPDIGVGFPEALRAFLRQDPDVIMVGEVRDPETARIAVRAALTGHLVLSTLHTNDAPSALPRLADMGVEPYLLAAAVRLVSAQRLVRLLCPECKGPLDGAGGRVGVPSGGAAAVARLRALAPGADPAAVFGPVGCPACRGTGYRGREGVHEVFPVDDDVAAAVARRAPAAELRAMMAERGGRPLRENAVRKLLAGRTSVDEVLRVA